MFSFVPVYWYMFLNGGTEAHMSGGDVDTIQLREWRQFFGLSQRELAKQAGLAVSTINDVETGKREPNWQTMRKLGKVFDATPAQLAYYPWDDSMQSGRSSKAERRAWLAARVPLGDDEAAYAEAYADALEAGLEAGDPIARDLAHEALARWGRRIYREDMAARRTTPVAKTEGDRDGN